MKVSKVRIKRHNVYIIPAKTELIPATIDNATLEKDKRQRRNPMAKVEE